MRHDKKAKRMYFLCDNRIGVTINMKSNKIVIKTILATLFSSVPLLCIFYMFGLFNTKHGIFAILVAILPPMSCIFEFIWNRFKNRKR